MRGLRTGMDRERGVVLIAVLALAALSAAIAMEVAYQARVETERVTLDHEWFQADLMAQNGLSVAIEILKKDDHDVDGADDFWRSPIVLEQSNGSIEIVIEDETGRFPLHKVLNEEQLLDLDYKRGLSRLLFLLEQPEEVTDRIIDYMDPDDLPFPQGAEGPEYAGLEPPRRPANRRMLSLDEIGHVYRIADDPELAGALERNVRLHGPGPININAAPPVVIASLSPSIPITKAEQIAARARGRPFKNVEEIGELVELGEEAWEEVRRKAGVGGTVFRVRTKGVVGSVSVGLTSIVELREGEMVIVRKEPERR